MARFAGLVEVTVGATLSGPSPVVKVQTKLLARLFPDRSWTPVVIVAVYVTPVARALLGVNVAVSPIVE
jgi:hypothetical protein